MRAVRRMEFKFSAKEYKERAPEFCIPEDNPDYSSEDGVLFNKDKTVLLRFPTESPIRHYKLPDSVEEIRAYSFGKCRLESLDLNKVRRAGSRALWSCESLKELDLGTEIQVLTKGMIFGCHGLHSLVLPPNVRELRDCFVEMCSNLNEITIPRTVKKMGRMPFGCGNVIVHFEYNGAAIHVREQSLEPGQNGDLIDLKYYDSTFRQFSLATHRNSYRPLTAFLRLAYPVDLTEEWKELYVKFLRRYVREFAAEIFAKNKVDWVRILVEQNVIFEDNIDCLIEDSAAAGKTAITAFLLDHKRKSLPERDDEFEL